jgi:predicted dehydrogenase
MRAAVIGAGQISKQHLGAMARCPDVTVVGVCDLSPVMAEAAADRFKIQAWFTDHERMLAEQRPDVVHVLTPAATHFSLARQCLEKGAHVFVEKPIAENLSQIEELLSLAANKQLHVIEDHNYQFNRDVQHIAGLVASGALGQVRHVDVDLCLDIGAAADPTTTVRSGSAATHAAGPISDFLTHLCYLSYLFIGDHQRVTCIGRQSTRPCGASAHNLQALVEGRDATARLGFSTDSQPDAFTIRLQGTRMNVQTNLFELGVLRTAVLGGPKPLVPIRNMLRRGRAEWAGAARSLHRKLGGGPGPYEGLWELVRRFYDSLKNGSPSPVSPQQILAVNRLYHEILNEAPSPCAC